MNDRELPKAATRWGASLMTRVYAASEAGSSPRRLAASGATTHDQLSKAGHLENLGLNSVGPDLAATLLDSWVDFPRSQVAQTLQPCAFDISFS